MLQFKTIRRRILFAFSIVVLFILVYSTYNFIHTRSTVSSTEQIIDKELQLLTADYDLAQSMAVRIASARGYVLSGNPEYKTIFEENSNLAAEQGKKLRAITNSADFEKYDKMSDEWNQYVQESVFAVYDAGDKELATKNLVAMDKQGTEIRLGFTQLANLRTDAINESGDHMISTGNTTLIVILTLSILTVVLSIVIAGISASRISKGVQVITTRMQHLAKGDFSEPLLEVKSKDELGQLTTATNTMMKKMNGMLKTIQATSADVSAHSEELTQASVEVKLGTEQISSTIAEIAHGTESQANNAAEVAATMTDFSSKLTEVNERSEHIQAASSNVLTLTSEGQNLMNSSTKQMATIDTIVKDAVEKVEDLSKETQEISKIVQVIHAIADQTNLLSLNAAIEAARAGEAGKGFAVVADEVRKLAEQVTLSVEDITKIVERILSGSAVVTTSLETGYKEVEQGTAQIAMTSETFTHIAQALKAMSGNINEMSGKLNDIVANSATINHAVDEIAAVSQQSAAGIEETSATVEQTSNAMDEISNSAATLAQMAENLNDNIRQFKLYN